MVNIKKWNEEYIQLTESQLANIVGKHSQNGFFVVSACRSKNTKEQNEAKTEELKQDIKKRGFTYTVAYGGGFKEKEDDSDNFDPEKPEINETSFIVYNYRRDKNGKGGKVDRDTLFNFALELCKKYNQDDVMFKEPNGKSYWYDRNGNIDATFEKGFKTNDDKQQYFTALRKDIRGNSNQQGKNGKMSKANAGRFSAKMVEEVMNGVFFNPPAASFIDYQRRACVENEIFFEEKTSSYFDY